MPSLDTCNKSAYLRDLGEKNQDVEEGAFVWGINKISQAVLSGSYGASSSYMKENSF